MENVNMSQMILIAMTVISYIPIDVLGDRVKAVDLTVCVGIIKSLSQSLGTGSPPAATQTHIAS